MLGVIPPEVVGCGWVNTGVLSTGLYDTFRFATTHAYCSDIAVTLLSASNKKGPFYDGPVFPHYS